MRVAFLHHGWLGVLGRIRKEGRGFSLLRQKLHFFPLKLIWFVTAEVRDPGLLPVPCSEGCYWSRNSLALGTVPSHLESLCDGHRVLPRSPGGRLTDTCPDSALACGVFRKSAHCVRAASAGDWYAKGKHASPDGTSLWLKTRGTFFLGRQRSVIIES